MDRPLQFHDPRGVLDVGVRMFGGGGTAVKNEFAGPFSDRDQGHGPSSGHRIATAGIATAAGRLGGAAGGAIRFLDPLEKPREQLPLGFIEVGDEVLLDPAPVDGVCLLEAPPPAHEGHAQLSLERADARGQRRLRDVAGIGRPPEMLFAFQGFEVFELTNDHKPRLSLHRKRRLNDRSFLSRMSGNGQPTTRTRGKLMAKVLCVLYDDPVDGYPTSYARDDIPKIERYPGGQTTPTPKAIDFTPGELLGSVSGELACASSSRGAGHTLVVTSDKDGPDSVFERELPDAEIVISQPFWPAYLTAERIAKAPKLKLAITAGIGSDHVDLQAAIERGITVAEVTYCNSISVSEHVVMMILSLVRNYIPSYQWVVKGGWNIADCVARSYDLEGMQVGTVAAGRIGLAVLRRLKPFDVKLHYTDRHRLPEDVEKELASPSTRRRVAWCGSATWSRSTRRSIPRPSTCSTTR